eukprot:g23000.t2
MDFHQLLAMNAGIIGANMSHLQLLSDLFEQLLAPHVNAQPGEAEIAADLLALRFFREAQGELQLKDDPSTRRGDPEPFATVLKHELAALQEALKSSEDAVHLRDLKHAEVLQRSETVEAGLREALHQSEQALALAEQRNVQPMSPMSPDSTGTWRVASGVGKKNKMTTPRPDDGDVLETRETREVLRTLEALRTEEAKSEMLAKEKQCLQEDGEPRFRRVGISAPRWSHGRPATSEEQSLKEQHRLEGLKLSARQEELEKTEEMQSRRGVEREKKISELEATLQAKGERCLQTEQELHESARELQEAAESWQSSRRECSEREAQSEAKAGELWSEMGELRRELKAEQLKWQGEQRAYQDQAERQRHQLSVCEASMQQEMQRREDQVEVSQAQFRQLREQWRSERCSLCGQLRHASEELRESCARLCALQEQLASEEAQLAEMQSKFQHISQTCEAQDQMLSGGLRRALEEQGQAALAYHQKFQAKERQQQEIQSRRQKEWMQLKLVEEQQVKQLKLQLQHSEKACRMREEELEQQEEQRRNFEEEVLQHRLLCDQRMEECEEGLQLEMAQVREQTLIEARRRQEFAAEKQELLNELAVVRSLTREQRLKLGTKSFDRLFHDQPEISNYFKTSNMRLAFIVGKALDFSARLFDEPALMVDEMTQLGLKHIMFQAQSQFFQPWVSALMAEIQQITADEEVVQGMNYALCVIGSIIAQAVETGSTPVLQAIVNDDVKALKSALRATPRAERAEAVLGRA